MVCTATQRFQFLFFNDSPLGSSLILASPLHVGHPQVSAPYAGKLGKWQQLWHASLHRWEEKDVATGWGIMLV